MNSRVDFAMHIFVTIVKAIFGFEITDHFMQNSQSHLHHSNTYCHMYVSLQAALVSSRNVRLW